MKKYIVLCSALLLIFAISGCSNKVKSPTIPQALDVAIKIQPKHINPNEKVTIQAIVTQGKEKVSDANEVEFEIWKSEQEKHKIIKAKSQGDGVYSVEHTFPENGTYSVIAHVTARDMHTMPQMEVIVGKPSSNADHHDEGEHEHTVSVQLNQSNFKVGQKTTLIATVSHDHAPLTKTTVEFEIWQGNAPKHQFTDATEIGNGKYSGEITFKNTGKYNVRVHVENDELHDHQEKEVNVEK